MSSINTIVKRNGEKVPFDPDKLNKWAEWAADIGVDWSSVVLESCRKCYDGCTSIELHQAMIDSCIDQETTQHLRMAGRLYIGKLLKDVFGGLDKVPTLSEMYHTMVEKSLWAKMSYSESDLQYLNGVINHTLDFEASLTEIKQITEKYAIVDRVAKTVMETPQFVYMRMAMGNMERMPKTRRLEDVVKLYTYLSQKKINAPTPFFINLGTPKKQYASCCVTTTKDSAASLAAADHIAYMMTCASAGIGAHIKTRSRGSPVRQGLIMHLGKIPYYKVAQAAVGANLQSSRGGAMTMHYNALDPEIMDLLTLKNVQAVEQKRVKDIDYSFGFNEEFARRVAKNESWMLVDYSECPELYEAMYEPDQSNFVDLYKQIESNPLIKKEFVNARDIALKALKEGVETGRIYLHRTDEMNRHTPFKDKIYSSNLCVAPETMLLTKRGHLRIDEICGETVDVWNGSEWSSVEVVKTSDESELISVVTDSGFELDCTPYHKFYISTNYQGGVAEKRAWELKPGDKLIKLETPVIQGCEELQLPYENGFFTGDGCYADGESRIYLYGEKRRLIGKFPIKQKHIIQDTLDREYFVVSGLARKYFVPDANYTVNSRINWLAGLLDADGCVVKCDNSQTLQLVSVEGQFLNELQLMLQTLGVQSKVTFACDAGYRDLPANNGTVEKKSYFCKAANRLLIAGAGIQQLLHLGIQFNRLNLNEHKPNRNASRFVKVKEVIWKGRLDSTYCVNEPKQHKAVFNGLLTGQCQEIALPTKGFNCVSELYKSNWKNAEYVPEIGLCSLGAIVAGNTSESEWEDVAYYTALMIDNVIEIMDYPFPQLAYTAKARRSIGVGITNLAYDMANKGYKYSTVGGKRYVHRLAEMHSYYLHKASLRLAKERGVCEWISKTKYPDGWLPIDTANKTIDDIVSQPLLFDWESLRKEIVEVGGIRNSVLEAFMPNESSSLATGGTNSIYPCRSLKVIKTSGTNKNLFIAPKAEELNWDYEIAWDVPTKDMLEVYAIIQKFTGQAISADLYISYGKDTGEKTIGAKELLTQFLYFTKLGLKTRYYINSSTSVVSDDKGCSSGGCTL